MNREQGNREQCVGRCTFVYRPRHKEAGSSAQTQEEEREREREKET